MTSFTKATPYTDPETVGAVLRKVIPLTLSALSEIATYDLDGLLTSYPEDIWRGLDMIDDAHAIAESKLAALVRDGQIDGLELAGKNRAGKQLYRLADDYVSLVATQSYADDEF